jgi:hypothetical protein
VRRCGELLKQFQTGPKGGRPIGNGGGTPTVFPQSQKEAAASTGISNYQRVTAVRVANVPAAAPIRWASRPSISLKPA